MKMPECITSRQNPTVKWLASLSEKKYRDAEGVFTADGDKLLIEAFRAGAPVSHVVLREGREDLLPLLEPYLLRFPDVRLVCLSESCFDKVTTEKSPQGVITVIKTLDNLKYYNIINKDAFSLPSPGGVIFLDAVRDPGNLGAVFRTAAAFGMTHAVLSADCADPFHPRAVRASMGALFHLTVIRVASLPEAVSAYRETGARVFAAELSPRAIPLSRAELSYRDAVVIGNEGHGVSPEVSAACGGSVYIPITSAVESLNASVAASLFIFEQMRGCLPE